MLQQLAPALRMTILLTVLTGFAYPGLVTGLCQLFFHQQANGSLVKRKGEVVGSSLIGQRFSRPEYFHSRPSAAGAGYDAAASGGSNLGPTSRKLHDRIQAAAAEFRRENPDYSGPIPADALTTSGSGLDPHISIADAMAQSARVAKARGLGLPEVEGLIAKATAGRDLGFLGEPRVNVLMLNLELDRRSAK